MLLLTTVDVLQTIKVLSGPASVFLEPTIYTSTPIYYVNFISHT